MSKSEDQSVKKKFILKKVSVKILSGKSPTLHKMPTFSRHTPRGKHWKGYHRFKSSFTSQCESPPFSVPSPPFTVSRSPLSAPYLPCLLVPSRVRVHSRYGAFDIILPTDKTKNKNKKTITKNKKHN